MSEQIQRSSLPDYFIDGIQRKNLPIEPENAIGFTRFMLSEGAPDSFIPELLGALQYVDKITFSHEVQDMAKAAAQIVGKKDWYCAVYHNEDDKSERSNYWMYQNLLEAGLPQAREVFGGYPGRSLRFLDEAIKDLPADSMVLFPDDMAVTGTAMIDLLRVSSGTSQFHALLLAASNFARDMIRRENISSFYQGKKIQTLKETMSKENRTFLDSITQKHLKGDQIHTSGFWTWYKIPDSFPRICLRGPHPLLHEEHYIPPYRK